MRKSTYIIIKSIAAIVSAFLIITGISFIFIGLSTTKGQFDEAIHVVPGITFLFYSLFPLLTFIFLKQHHTKFLRYALITISVFLITYYLIYSNRRSEIIQAQEQARQPH